jgi:inosine-uridine nucleoside N-ribohydrolase
MMTVPRVKIHLDTDLGGDIDDLCALALLLRWPGVEVTGITTVIDDDLINVQHDPLACAVALGWDGVTVESLRVSTEVRDGWLYERVDQVGRPMRVVTAVQAPRFNDFWLSLVTE